MDTIDHTRVMYVTRYICYSRKYIVKESKLNKLDFCLLIIHTLLHLFNIYDYLAKHYILKNFDFKTIMES